MHIILVPNRLATARTLNITPRLLAMLACAFVLIAFLTAFLLSWLGIHFSLPLSEELIPVAQQEQQAAQAQRAQQAEIEQEAQLRKTETYLRNSVSSMAVKLGEMQAKLMHLDSLSERISKLSGVNGVDTAKAPSKGKDGKDGKGGPFVSLSPLLSVTELQREIDRLAEAVDERGDALTEIESQLMERRIKTILLPTIVPIVADHIGSPFGRRIDPIAGVGAMHEGIDFVAEQGTRVSASAGGVVIGASYHPQYGKLVEIDHGNDFSSRYAHLSKYFVRVGQVVKRGQVIAASGNTGRSTGPHLHFEVRYKGGAQNPTRFFQMGNALASNAAAPRKAEVPPGKGHQASKKAR